MRDGVGIQVPGLNMDDQIGMGQTRGGKEGVEGTAAAAKNDDSLGSQAGTCFH